FIAEVLVRAVRGKAPPPLTEINLDKRGFLVSVFDGRYKLARFYSPNGFNTPKTLDQLFKHNDVQVFDLKNDPNEMKNLAIEAEKHRELIERLNGTLNNMMAREVGANDGNFLPESVRPKSSKRD